MATESDSLFAFSGAEGLGVPAMDAGDASQFGFAPVTSLGTDDICRTLEAASQVSYHWSIASDTITWSSNAEAILGCRMEDISTGRRFANLLDTNNFTSRYDTVMHGKDRDQGKGVGFEIEYLLKPRGRSSDQSLWIEDAGRWFADASGLPSHVYGVMRLSDVRHHREQELSFLSNCDPLTGMMNRSRMASALHDAISVATTEKSPCAFAIIAVNNLDVMNEAYGYEVADEVIVELGQRLRKVMRAGDAIARYSGSKFGIILNNCKADELQSALERFMRAVRDSVIETKLGPVWALLSIGAVTLPALGDNVTTAVAHAEEALSEAFRHPGDCKVVYTSSETRKARRALNARCATEIVACLRNSLFKLAFQPICDARTGDIIMHEALLRMEDSSGNLITAAHLVPIAEQLGLVRLIDRAVLQLALQTLESYPDAKLSVNVSATTANDPRWNSQLLEMIAPVPDLARRLVLEVTETTALGDIATLNDFMKKLRQVGCGIALDDFGAGYTSYRNIKELPLSHIKLDGSYCQNLAGSAANRMFIESLVKLANAFDLKIVAEWVETEADAHVLRDLGVDYLQGHLWGEASVVAPWQTSNPTSFHLSPSHNTNQGLPPDAAPHDEEPFAKEQAPGLPTDITAQLEDKPAEQAETDLVVDDAGKSAAIAVEPHSSTTQAEDGAEDDFDWAKPEEGLSKLKDALAALNAAFGTMTKTSNNVEDTTEQLAS